MTCSASLVFGTASAQSETRFAVLGDMPYDTTEQVEKLEGIGSKLRELSLRLVIFYGDIKGGGESCDDELLESRRDLVLGLVPDRVIYTPGDNEWTDCDREAAGAHNELERLWKIRSLFFANPTTGGQDWTPVRQYPNYPENALWSYGDLQFVTLHVVGTSNGRRKIKPAASETAGLSAEQADALEDGLEQYAREMVNNRDKANLLWLGKAFEAASDAEGLVVVMHADPLDLDEKDQKDGREDRVCGGDVFKNCNPYKQLMDRLFAETLTFQKPVLLVHGSTEEYCLDWSFAAPGEAEMLWRLNGPGDGPDNLDAAIVDFVKGARLPFQVSSLLTDRSVPKC